MINDHTPRIIDGRYISSRTPEVVAGFVERTVKFVHITDQGGMYDPIRVMEANQSQLGAIRLWLN